MGTIVINQTDCKQNVILQSSLDGITGGYYDASGVWHDIGTPQEDPGLYPMEEGVRGFYGNSNWQGRAVAVAGGNEILFDNPVTFDASSGSYLIFDPVSSNGYTTEAENINGTTDVLFTIPANAEVVVRAYDIDIESLQPDANCAIGMRVGDTSAGLSLSDILAADTEKEATFTTTEAKAITCIFGFCHKKIKKASFKYSVTVNGVKWI